MLELGGVDRMVLVEFCPEWIFEHPGVEYVVANEEYMIALLLQSYVF